MSEFGVELRRRRELRRLSLAGLADRVHYTKGYLSKIENGQLPPNRKLAGFLDAALDADGALIALASDRVRRPGARHSPSATQWDRGEARVPDMDRDRDRDQIMPHDGRPDWGGEPSSLGSALPAPLALPSPQERAESEDLWLETHFRDEFDRYRRLSQGMAPGFVLRRLIVDFNTLTEIADTSLLSSTRLRLLAARYAELIGWMSQEAGRRDHALAWTRRAADLAARSGAADFAAYTLVREAELAMYEGVAGAAVELAARVLAHPHAGARTKGLAGHRVAQAYALRGDHRRCLASLEQAQSFLDAGSPAAAATGIDVDPDDGPVIGSSTVGDLGNAVAGWCHYDLGRPQHATELLAGALERTPAAAHRSRALFGARLALAYEASGDLDRMQEVTVQVLADTALARSASAYSELRGLSRALVRRTNVRAFRDLRRRLDEVLVRAR